MCGIVGFTQPGKTPERVLRNMMVPIAHRGPDQDGIWADDDIAVGHLRLTIIDLAGGQQPRIDPETGDLLVFNGELYNYREHAKALQARGVRLRDASDTEVLFQMLRVDGVEATLARIDGMFAFAYRDGRSGTLWLARDRFGEKPLYYAQIGEQLIFGSELKALRQHPACGALGFDLEAVGQYLTFDYVPAPRTGFAGIRKLLPGHFLSFEDGVTDEAPYWRLPLSDKLAQQELKAGGESAALDRLDTLLRQSIRDRLVADVPVGIFLSGGVDSALIAAIASGIAPGIAAYTIKLPGESYDETPFAAQVASQYGLTHHVHEVSGDAVLHALDQIERCIDEPFADASIVPTYLLCEAARSGVKVALGGDGGDELFAGYINFQANQLGSVMARLPRVSGALLQRLAATLPASDRYMGLSFKLAQLSQGFGAPETVQSFLWMAPFDATARRRLLVGDIPVEETFDPVAHWLGRASPTGSVDRLQYLFASLYLPDDILTKVDRASMYNSLEVRAPFLSSALADFAMALPPEWRVNGLRTKYLLRRLAERYLPTDLVWRKKHGFALPVSAMLRGPLRARVSDTLLDPSNPMAVYFNRSEIDRLLTTHMTRRRDQRKQLWSLYCLFRFAATAQQNRLADAA